MFESIEAYSQQILEFIRVNQAWAPPVVMLLAFGESLAFISLLLPAWAALVGIGALISAGQINFWPIWVAASIGAALGDWLSYWIGRKLEHTAQHAAHRILRQNVVANVILHGADPKHCPNCRRPTRNRTSMLSRRPAKVSRTSVARAVLSGRF